MDTRRPRQTAHPSGPFTQFVPEFIARTTARTIASTIALLVAVFVAVLATALAACAGARGASFAESNSVTEPSVGAAALPPVAEVSPDEVRNEARPASDTPGTRPQPHPSIAVGSRLTAFTGPRFLTGESFIPEARTVLVDELGRVRALLKGLPPDGKFPVVKLPGALAVAGLHDAHVHLQGIGQMRDRVQLVGAKTAAEVRSRVAAWTTERPDASIVRGRGWDQSLFPRAAWPTWKDLEGADPKGRPILLDRVDGHAAWANRALLTLAGITEKTPDPAGGKLLRDATGAPTGILIDNAIELVTSKLPGPTSADVERWMRGGLHASAEAGLVAVHDMATSVEAAEVLVKLDDAGQLPVRVFVYLDGSDDRAYPLLQRQPATDKLRFMGVKLFVDGAMGSRGAALLDDYADDRGNKGLLLMEPAALVARIRQVHDRGFAAAVHAIGDRGNRVVLDAMQAAPAPAGVRDRIEHAQLVATAASGTDDFARFSSQRVIASMQPTHATSDMRWAEQRVGAAKVRGAYAWRTMLEHQVRVAFGSDAPVEDVRPQLGIYAALTRQDADGKPVEGFLPGERLTQTETLAAFAAGAAWAVGMESHLGALTPGMFFDVTLFDDDAAALAARGDAKAWLRARPVGIVVGGSLRTLGADTNAPVGAKAGH